MFDRNGEAGSAGVIQFDRDRFSKLAGRPKRCEGNKTGCRLPGADSIRHPQFQKIPRVVNDIYIDPVPGKIFDLKWNYVVGFIHGSHDIKKVGHNIDRVSGIETAVNICGQDNPPYFLRHQGIRFIRVNGGRFGHHPIIGFGAEDYFQIDIFAGKKLDLIQRCPGAASTGPDIQNFQSIIANGKETIFVAYDTVLGDISEIKGRIRDIQTGAADSGKWILSAVNWIIAVAATPENRKRKSKYKCGQKIFID